MNINQTDRHRGPLAEPQTPSGFSDSSTVGRRIQGKRRAIAEAACRANCESGDVLLSSQAVGAQQHGNTPNNPHRGLHRVMLSNRKAPGLYQPPPACVVQVRNGRWGKLPSENTQARAGSMAFSGQDNPSVQCNSASPSRFDASGVSFVDWWPVYAAGAGSGGGWPRTGVRATSLPCWFPESVRRRPLQRHHQGRAQVRWRGLRRRWLFGFVTDFIIGISRACRLKYSRVGTHGEHWKIKDFIWRFISLL